MIEVAVIRTPWTRADLLDAYAHAWSNVVGGNPSQAALAILYGQACLECAHGQSCFNFNVGNVMAFTKSWSGLAHRLHAAPECGDPNNLPAGAVLAPNATIACSPGKVKYYPKAGSTFRAYANFLEGCSDKLRVLERQWPDAINALADATTEMDAITFSQALTHPLRYMSADAPEYGRVIASIAKPCLKNGDGWPAEYDAPRLFVPRTLDTEAPAEWQPSTNAEAFLKTLVSEPEESNT